MELHELQTEIEGLLRRHYPEAKRGADEGGRLIEPLARRIGGSLNVSQDQLLELAVFLLLPGIEGEEES